MATDDILFSRHGGRAHVVLNRPAQLNAVTHEMLLRLESRLVEWETDDSVALVTITGAGDKAFAAGGDIRALYEQGREDGSRNFGFYADEYRINTRIKRYRKPYVAFIDGIVMGGGVGLSLHGSLRVAGGRTLFAMPETSIGLIPDVGGSFFLPRLPGGVGMYLGLTGARLEAGDCVELGLADCFVPSSGTEAALADLDSVTWSGDRREADRVVCEIVDRHAAAPPEAAIGPLRDGIDSAFCAASPAGIFVALACSKGDWPATQIRTLAGKSPTSLVMAFQQLRAGGMLDFEDCMRMEYRLARACMTGHDFYEGVRAAIIDKDGSPRWHPAMFTEVDEAEIARAFEPLGAEELVLHETRTT